MSIQTYVNINEVFQNVNGASFVGIDTETTVTLTGGQKNPHKGRVTKRMTNAQVMVFQNKNTNAYENMVCRRLEQEGKDPSSFVLSPRTWGTRIPNSPVLLHVGKDNLPKFYVEFIFLKAGKVEYFLNGKLIDKTEIEGLPEKDEAEQGGLDNKVCIRTFTLKSITNIRIDRTEYTGPFCYA